MNQKPFWMPDTQGFLAIAIITLMGSLAFLLIGSTVKFDDKVAGAFMTLLGVLTGCLKDVYSFFFGSSKGSEKKDDALISGAVSPTSTPAIIPPSQPIGPQGDVGKALVLVAVLLTGLLLMGGDARAQTRPRLTGDLVGDIKAATSNGPIARATGGGPLNDILGALDEKLLPDLQYALRIATASGSKVTAPCYQAWIDIIQTRQKAVTNADGTPLELPSPRLITDFEKAVELRNALQPDSDFMLRCSPVANMVKADMISFIGKVMAGGAGLATLVPGL